jgi:hypothetical protein
VKKFDMNEFNINPLSSINEMVRRQQDQLNKTLEEASISARAKIEREIRSIELQETLVEQNNELKKLKEIEINFLKSMSEDASKIVNLLESLEMINKTNGIIVEANLLEIEKRLDKMIKSNSPAKLHEVFLEEIKRQMVDKGVDFALQFMIAGLKILITKGINFEK